MNLDTFLVALYTIVDDLYQANIAPLMPVRCGPKPRLSDSEMLTLALCAQWQGASERAFLRYAAQHWRGYFPNLTTQSACNRRIRKLAWALAALAQEAARELAAHAAPFQVVDTVPLPLMRRCRGRKHKLFGTEANIGRGGADRDWYYGCKLMLAATNQGVITGFLLSPASTEDHWAAEAFFCWRADPLGTPVSPEELPRRRNGQKHVGPKGPQWPQYGPGEPAAAPYLGDNGFFGAGWQPRWLRQYGAAVLAPGNYVGERAKHWRSRHRSRLQVVETVNGSLEQVFHLHFPKARSVWGLLTRVSAKVAALNLGIQVNRQLGRPDLALATLFNC